MKLGCFITLNEDFVIFMDYGFIIGSFMDFISHILIDLEIAI